MTKIYVVYYTSDLRCKTKKIKKHIESTQQKLPSHIIPDNQTQIFPINLHLQFLLIDKDIRG